MLNMEPSWGQAISRSVLCVGEMALLISYPDWMTQLYGQKVAN